MRFRLGLTVQWRSMPLKNLKDPWIEVLEDGAMFKRGNNQRVLLQWNQALLKARHVLNVTDTIQLSTLLFFQTWSTRTFHLPLHFFRKFRKKNVLPRFLPSYFSRELIFARGNHHFLAEDYSEDHDILLKSNIIDLVLQAIFFNFGHV